MRKRLLSLALALALSLGLFTVPASAAGATVIEIVPADAYDQFLTDGSGNYWSSGGMSNFTEGIASCGSRFSGYGAIDATGKVILPPGTSGAEITFHDGVAWAFKDGYWIAVDTSGSELFRLKPEDIGARSVEVFYDGMAKVSNREGMSGYLDTTGKLVIPMEYEVFPGEYRGDGNFHDGMAQVYDRASAFFGYIDKTGRLAVPYQYDTGTDFAYGFARVRLGDTLSYIDKTGKVVAWLPEGYTFSQKFTSEIMVLRGKNEFVLANKNGQIVSGPYDGVHCYTNFCQVYKTTSKSSTYSYNKYGYVNDAGVEIIPCQYDSLGEFRDGFTVGRTAGSSGYTFSIIDKTGKVTGTWTGAHNDSLSNIGNGCFVTYDDKSSSTKRYGIIDYTGREIVPCKYKTIGEFSCGVAPVRDFTGETGFVNTAGEEVVPCKFRDIVYRGEGVYVVKGYHDDGRWSAIRGSGWTEPSVSSAPSTPAQPSGPSANPTNSKVLVNGKEVAFDAYTIDGSNYFKLRDLAYVLNGTEKQFEVGWDNASKTITLTSGSAYTANGSEMAKGGGAQSASVSASKLIIDGKEVSLTAYSIGGNNYFKLRDIGQAFDFGIGWDNASKTITIDTSAGYTA